jgi:hypothetical protein
MRRDRRGNGRAVMKGLTMRQPSPAFVVAMIALFVALGGTAGAVVTAAVPLAKRALVADNAKKLGGQSLAQLTAKTAQAVQAAAAAPGPASTAAGLVTIKTAAFTVAEDGEQIVTATCDSGSKVVGGGFANPTSALVLSAGSFAAADGTGWTEDLINIGPGTGSGQVVAVCLR